MDHGTDFWSNLFNTDFEVEFLARNSVRFFGTEFGNTILGRFGFEIRTFLKIRVRSGRFISVRFSLKIGLGFIRGYGTFLCDLSMII